MVGDCKYFVDQDRGEIEEPDKINSKSQLGCESEISSI